MKEQVLECDIKDLTHSGEVLTVTVAVIFDHDQEDGQSKTEPYLEQEKIEMCSGCYQYMLENKRYVYGFGAMGNNEYFLKAK